MIALFTFLFIFGILIIVHEFGHFIVAKKMGVKVERFSIGFGYQIFKKQKQGTEYSISVIPFGGYVKLAGDNLEEYKGAKDEYLSQVPGRRFHIIFFGPLLNYVLGFLCFAFIFFAGYPTLTTKVGGLIDGFGAKESGIKLGDRITAIDGKRVDLWEDMQKIAQSKKASSVVKVSFVRENKEQTVEIKIKMQEIKDLVGQKHNVGLMGISPSDEIIKVRHGLLTSVILGAKKTWSLSILTYKALWRLITGRLSLRDSVTGPLGMFYITSKVARLGIIAVLHLMAVLSVNLAIINLLPLPVLDGGHIFLLGLEKIRGKYLSLKAERIITKFGFVLIMSLVVIVTCNDLLRFWDKIIKFFGRS